MKTIYFLTFSVFLCCIVACSDEASIEQDFTKTKSEISIDEAVMNLEASFITSVRGVENSLKPTYPDYYCGYYGNKGTLVILVKDPSDISTIKDLKQRCNSANIEFKQAKLSMNELEKIRDEVSNSKTNGVWDKYHITGCGIDVTENKILILVDDISKSNTESLKNYFPEYKSLFNFLKFEIKDSGTCKSTPSTRNDVSSTVPVIPGAGYYGVGGHYGTVGYCTTYKMSPCFVTTAHSVGRKNNTIKDIKDNTTKVATVTEYDPTGFDLAVCTIEEKLANSNAFNFMNSSVTLIPKTYQVSIANETKVGCKSFYSNKNQETATVYRTDIELKGRTQRVFALAAYKAQEGDSGCLIFCPDNNKAVGIHVADGGNGYSAYLPCKYINMKYGTLPK